LAVAEVNVQYYSPEAVEEPLIAFSLLSNILCQILPRVTGSNPTRGDFDFNDFESHCVALYYVTHLT